MMGILYFLHLAGFTVWLGSMLLLAILLLAMRKNLGEWNSKPLFLLTASLVKWVLNGAALVVLASGVGLVQTLGLTTGNKPFYVSFMEQTGGMTILLFIVLMTWFSNRASKKLREDKNQAPGAFPKLLARYSAALSVFLILGVSVLLVVSFRVL
ncbi:hypothetical protein [Tumebacillus flagellatus]|nr:hypothetical protein [Tumebacillus flagellatus]